MEPTVIFYALLLNAALKAVGKNECDKSHKHRTVDFNILYDD